MSQLQTVCRCDKDTLGLYGVRWRKPSQTYLWSGPEKTGWSMQVSGNSNSVPELKNIPFCPLCGGSLKERKQP